MSSVTSTDRTGTTTTRTGDITPNGYMREVAFPRGVTLRRWVFPETAAEDLALMARMS